MKKPSSWQSFTFPTQTETRVFIGQASDVTERLSTDLWNRTSGYPGLLTARRVATASIPRTGVEKDYEYSPTTNRYTNVKTGREVSRKQLEIAVVRVSNDVKKQMRVNTQQLIAGAIMFIVWYHRSRELLWSLYKAVFVLHVGGFLFDDQVYRDAFYLLILSQFNRFDNFALHLDNMPDFSGHEIARAGSYGGYGKAVHQNANLTLGAERGQDEARRVLGPNENHCYSYERDVGCIDLALQGWIPIRQMIPIGGATCRDNCQCRIETRRSYET
jgi:hypothetical protein